MHQLRREDFVHQSTYAFHTRRADRPSQTAARTETLKLTMTAINRIIMFCWEP